MLSELQRLEQFANSRRRRPTPGESDEKLASQQRQSVGDSSFSRQGQADSMEQPLLGNRAAQSASFGAVDDSQLPQGANDKDKPKQDASGSSDETK